jgi:hypothetical protein
MEVMRRFGMDKELIMIICISSSVLLGMLGGYRWKWLRRFVLPVILGGLALMAGFSIINAGAMTSCLIGSLCLPYGERTPYWGKALTFMAIFGSTLWLGFTYLQIISVILTIALFKLSNTKWGENIMFWTAWTAITFGLLGITISSLIGG